jgi:periplasmic divalent cation tolerance protein
MGDRYCLVLTTTGTEDEAESLAAAIVEAHLAACVQVHRVRSFYIWQDQLHREPEWVLAAKTRTARFAALEAFIRERHSYETPEVVQVPITAGSADYLRWLDANTAHITGPAGG